MDARGFGREKGAQALDEFLATKNVMIDFSNVQRDPFAMRRWLGTLSRETERQREAKAAASAGACEQWVICPEGEP